MHCVGSLLQLNRAKKGHVETFTINPKCVRLGELYGETDPNTFEWSDGLIATATRRFARDSHGSDGDSAKASASFTASVSYTARKKLPDADLPADQVLQC